MTTYQDIVDYMNKNYNGGKFTLVKHDVPYTITNGVFTIDIYNDCYKSTFYIGIELGQLLLDILNTPVNQRNNPGIKPGIKPEIKGD